jgi:hypothetical protein
MNPLLKTVLINAAKNAVNAALTAAPLNVVWTSQFNFHNWKGVEHTLAVMLSAAVAREISVYYPVVLKWSQSAQQ